MTDKPNQPHTDPATDAADIKETNRVEAFSDGVIAIAITLLAFQLTVPTGIQPGSLLSTLAEDWPIYLSFVTSFFTILVMWINHHRLFSFIRRVDTRLNLLNGLLMMGITVTPFATSLIAAYVRSPSVEDQRTAGFVLGGLFISISLVYNVLWRHAAYWGRLLARDASPARVEAITRQYRYGPPLYTGCALLSLVDARLSQLAFLLIAVYFLLTPAPRN